jgi:hypothetical protein
MTNKVLSDLQSIRGLSFTSAYKLRVGNAARQLIIAQPGYQAGLEMCIATTSATSCGLRLYVRVGGAWLDGSLQDIN